MIMENENEIEIWLDVIDYEGLYQISNFGQVKSFIKYKNGKILKVGLRTDGYFQVNLYKNNEMKTFLIHRLVCLSFLENLENKKCVNHIDNNPSNNRL